MQLERRLRGISGPLLDVMRFIELPNNHQPAGPKRSGKEEAYNDSVPVNLVNCRSLLDDPAFALKAALLLAETALQHGICGQHLLCGVRVFDS